MKLSAFMLCLFAFSGVCATVGREYDVAYFTRSSDLSAFGTLANAETPELPYSSRAMRELFATCGSVQQGLIYALQSSEAQAAVDSACIVLARKVMQRNPTYSAAHTIAMFSSSEPADITGSLILSQITAPRESWNAKLRLLKGLPLYGPGQSDLNGALESDIRFLSQSFGGRTWLAALYQSDKQVRSTIAGIIDTRPDKEKAAFLQEVRRIGQD